MQEELSNILNQIGLTLSEEKTKVTHITEGFNFLGYRIIRSIGTSGKMAPKILVPDDAIKRFQHNTREILAPRTTRESTSAKIPAQNYLTRGWCQYYKVTSSPGGIFDKIQQEVFWDMAHWRGRKYKLRMPAVMKRYSDGKTLRTKTTRLIMPREYKATRRIMKTWHNPYTGTEEIKRENIFSYNDFWYGHEDRRGQGDLREEVIQLKGTTCMSCGIALHPSEVETDHIIPRKRFKDPRDADRMSNQQVLCTQCHRAKTKKELKVLSRMR